MNRSTQEELPLWPTPRWPSVAYLADAFLVYLVATIFCALLFLVGIVVIARPLWVVIFVAGAIVGVVGFRCWRSTMRRLSRIMGMFPHHHNTYFRTPTFRSYISTDG